MLPFPLSFVVAVLVIGVVAGAIIWPKNKPRLVAFLPGTDPTIQAVPRRAFWHVGVENQTDIVIERAHVQIQVALRGHPITELPARWDSRPEPFVAYTTPPQLSPQLLQDSQVYDLVKASKETLAFMVRCDGRQPHAFGAWSYANPTLELPPPLGNDYYAFRFLITGAHYRGAFGILVNISGPSFGEVSVTPDQPFNLPEGFDRIDWG